MERKKGHHTDVITRPRRKRSEETERRNTAISSPKDEEEREEEREEEKEEARSWGRLELSGGMWGEDDPMNRWGG